MFIVIKSLLRALILPPAGPLILALAGTLLLASRAAGALRRAAWTLLVAGLSLLWLLSTPAVAQALSRMAVRYPALDPGRPLQAQAIVILGGPEAFDNVPEYGGPAAGLDLLARVHYAAFLARRTSLPVLVSGTPEETQAMRATLARDFGIEVRWVEDRSRDTFENAHLSTALLRAAGLRRILLVTSAEHEWRAAHEFAAAGLLVEPAPVTAWARQGRGLRHYVPDSRALLQSRTALYEILGDWVRRFFAATHLRVQTP
jgi:uncharacterized SAM-binding protein YcdF (DUF218 family)